ncbi:acetyl-CoA synthetase-like protein [Punctularia strigosozonata HHB-11173 SS5]|uniref:Acetyl-CoA synthetase-like protein n=1 Tax=Punctularia strigosozonata (strain HHB-11173) TaxID=741275 RepID=R7S5E2_PUNST|nr:acetyl-CoA synthetase-like protein [Punctularia strigosozonata HHB-11173 SS5]EIN05194.1 acetyl-CoA synthetase-like protein [Punctularia strigosozonata HHB-11173 SS5]
MATKVNFGAGSVEVGAPAQPGESRARRLAICADKLIEQPLEGIETIHDCVLYAARTHGTKKALGWRDVVDIIEEEKEVTKHVGGKEVKETKKWKYFQLSDYKYLNYLEVKEAVSEVARGLVDLGVTADDIFNVYASTSLNWQLVAHACASISTAIATAYDSLGEAGLTHSLNEPNCVGVYTDAELLPVLAKVIGNTPSLRIVIYSGEAKPAVLDSIRQTRENIQVLTIDELRARGKPLSPDTTKDRFPKPSSVACIMYTSGTTGAPKGVVITHSNAIAAVGAVYKLLGHHFNTDDAFLAYLPLAHILEYIVELCLYFVGMTIGYGRVKTLTDQSVRGCSGDMVAFKPTIMVGVPAVWELIRKGIVGKVQSGGAVTKSVFSGALTVKRAKVPGLSQVVDAVVLSKVKAATGGRLRLALSGGAALSKETQEFLNLALVQLLQGYGMTESCGMCAILPPELMQYGSVGLPVPAIEIKLLDVKEAGYDAQGNPPQGEVCIRGPAVTKGYYKRDDLNNDESIFTKDGWLRTGDVGRWNPDGTLSLVDRIKNLVKLQGGEYIALESLEATYKSCNLVSNICVHATTDAKQPIAIVVPNEHHLRHALKSLTGVNADAPLRELCHDARVSELVMKECNAAGKKSGFKTMELLQAVVLSDEEWTPENGIVTAAQKVQRKKVAEKFEKEIKEAYKNQ